MKEFLKRRTDLSNGENIAYILAMSVFLPYYITILAIAVTGFYVLFNSKARKAVYHTTGAFLVPLFAVFTAVTAIVYKNYLGLAASVLFYFILTLGLYLRAVMTREIYERSLNICCVSSLFAVLVCFIEKLMHFSDIWYRCCGDIFKIPNFTFYGHPNFLGAIMASVIIICAYKVIVIKENKKYYYAIALLAAVVIFFTESMFAWIEVFIGLSILLLLARRHQLLGILFILTAFAAVLLYTMPEIFPRTAHIDSSFNSRVIIWDLSIKSIKENIWFGRGFFTYYQISLATPGAYIAKHAHNIVFEFLLSFGIIGSVMLFAMMFIIFQKVVLCKNFLRKSGITYLILSVTAAVLIHSITDMTMIWMQTFLLYCLILSGVGAEEQIMYRIFKTKKETNG